MTKAEEANSRQNWDRIWADPKEPDWRQRVLKDVYDRIVKLVPERTAVIDLGGGVGTLARRLKRERHCHAVVWDHSREAVSQAPDGSEVVDIAEWARSPSRRLYDHKDTLFVSTEFFEHIDAAVRTTLLQLISAGSRGLIVSVPNNRLGPEEEAQHTRKWTALEFLTELREYFGAECRVEVMGGFLLGVCGPLAKKQFTLSFTMPVRDEEKDIERTLASFRGVADEIVIGIDYRSKDRTEEIARQYAERVFLIEDPKGPPGDEAPKVHFGHCRNHCIERCSGDWIFMSEGHEYLRSGHDELLSLDALDAAVKVAFVRRVGQRMTWGYPWLHRNDQAIRYKRSTHNVLDFPPSYYVVHLPGISTYHQRHPENAASRKKQRAMQNRVALTDDWLKNGNDNSLMYLGSEWSTYDPKKAIQRLKEFLAVNRSNGPQRYHARLQCARLLAREGDKKEAEMVLLGAEADDWSRIDHWFYLGDLASMEGKHEKAIQYYLYASTRLGDVPFCPWWVDMSIYGYLTAQRLVETYAELGDLPNALYWARRARWLMAADDELPEEAVTEAQHNIQRIKVAMLDNGQIPRWLEHDVRERGLADDVTEEMHNTTAWCLEESWARKNGAPTDGLPYSGFTPEAKQTESES